VDGSVLPGYFGLEAGQSAVGDIFNWWVNYIQPGGKNPLSHRELDAAALKLKPGESGLLALDWNNGTATAQFWWTSGSRACSLARRFTRLRWKFIARSSRRRRSVR
jgi:hypothetical protein